MAVDGFLEALWQRHTANLTFREIRRAAQAVSAVYVEGRGERSPAAALASDGKRAAFAAYFGALHLLTVTEVVTQLDAAAGLTGTVVDLGCGTGVAGAAWATAASGVPAVLGVEQNPWAVREARWTLEALGLRGRVARGDATRAPVPADAKAVVAGYFVNEVSDSARSRLLKTLARAAERGARLLVVEPIAKRMAPWWSTWVEAFRDLGGRDDVWRLPVGIGGHLADLDRATGLDHSVLKARSLYVG